MQTFMNSQLTKMTGKPYFQKSKSYEISRKHPVQIDR